jgi:hypothetical protein
MSKQVIMQAKPHSIQRAPMLLERGTILQRAAVNTASTHSIPPIVHDVLSSPGQSLDAGTRTFMESRFAHDFSGVRVHSDERAADSARSVNALAYTVGRDVVFGAGQYTPGTMAGKRLLAHELTHVVQQGGLRAEALDRIDSPTSANEKEAASIAERLEENMLHQSQASAIVSSHSKGTLQREDEQKASGEKEDPDEKELKEKVGGLVRTKFGGDYRRAFDHYDANHDGSVDTAEIEKLLEDANVGYSLTRGGWVSGILKKMDTNKNGKIEWAEFESKIK